ncbi:hypothetical protein MACH26_22370 [Planctobacterium marinum]|uniref:Uncharacterized protein n=2 Tax=Planctobacterium marinum TaxID=1631968 RepID=A0AA48HL18_9ALTE|nr:hypothetical protein MACH26_22370 [Planctobacterium marinum]
MISLLTATATYFQYDAKKALEQSENNITYHNRKVEFEALEKKLEETDLELKSTSSSLERRRAELSADEQRLEDIKKQLDEARDEEISKRDSEITSLSSQLATSTQQNTRLTSEVDQLKSNIADLRNQLNNAADSSDIQNLQNTISEKDKELRKLQSNNQELTRQIEFNAVAVTIDLTRNVRVPFFIPGSNLGIRLDNVTENLKNVDFSYGLNRNFKFTVNDLSIGDAIARELDDGYLYVFEVVKANPEGTETATLKVSRVINRFNIDLRD